MEDKKSSSVLIAPVWMDLHRLMMMFIWVRLEKRVHCLRRSSVLYTRLMSAFWYAGSMPDMVIAQD